MKDIYVDACMNELPGCCGVGVIYGLGERDEGVPLSGWDKAILVTTVAHQKSAIAKLKKARFTPLRRFKNPRTGNMVTIWYHGPT